jgi:hypothetical protein
MRSGFPRVAILAAMFLATSTMGTFCICNPDSDTEPPETTTECGEGAQPAEGEATLVLSNPDTGLALAEGEILPVEYGDQGGQHVFVLVQQHATAKAAWTYQLEFHGLRYDNTQGVIGSNTVIVDLCAPGWTESTVPVFLNSGSPGEVTLRIRATAEGSAELTSEVKIVIE